MAVWAHTPGLTGEWHSLPEHLERTAKIARQFAEGFDGAEQAYHAGLWHDLGKFNPAFQEYLAAANAGRHTESVPHAIWGASLVYALSRRMRMVAEWKEVALPIAGHHAGLHHGGQIAQLCESFIRDHPQALELMAKSLTGDLLVGRLPRSELSGRDQEFFIRMVFSALVDADYLDTENHFDPVRAALRGRDRVELEGLWNQFLARREELLSTRSSDTSPSLVRVREEVYTACVSAAAGPTGAYRLTVPTGGGKTISGLAFALLHARQHHLKRVVVAMPYTSIIEQTASVFRSLLGEDAVLEHHSGAPVPDGGEEQDERTLRTRLASENWDLPVVATTNVQLFESLFSNRPSKARRLHNLAQSVIILDEVQTLPEALLRPTLDALRSLIQRCGTTVVFATATQPAFEDVGRLPEFGDIPVREIVPQHTEHFATLRRVEFALPDTPLSWDEVGREVSVLQQVMVVLNARRDALALLESMPHEDGLFHLSTLLCGLHRRRVLQTIRTRLEAGLTVRLVATQVVEAGVDIDFPEVWRAMGPLDRIVQAAGRCNREGRMERGRVVVFTPAAGREPRGAYHVGSQESRALLVRHGPDALHEPETFREYFARLYAAVETDKPDIQSLREALDYPEVARRFRLIEDDTVPVVVDYEDGLERLREWQRRPGRLAWRRLQPHVVNIRRRDLTRDDVAPFIEEVSQGLYRWVGIYSTRTGIASVVGDPADLY
jgi:CRISPR-associated endonuclease/helicase Cas3